jgi:NCS1 family nucleobase:cation symporter-1
MHQTEQPARLEQHTIQPIPLNERHGTPTDLFTIWTGTNIMLLTVVTGALSVTVFKQPFWWAVLALVVGNLVGAVFMALHSAQGPQLGVPQMVQTRGQFGSYGAILVVGLVIFMYLGFFASVIVLGGQAIHLVAPAISTNVGVGIVGLLSLIATIFGYDLIHSYTRVITYVSIAVTILAFIWIVFVHGIPAVVLGSGPGHSVTMAGFIGTVSVAALWQLAYAPYVSDYSRYLPFETKTSTAFWSTYLGTVLGSVFPMALGALVGLAAANGDIVEGLALLTGAVGPLVIIAFAGGIAANGAMNLYCCTLSTMTIGQTLLPAWSPGAMGRTLISLALFAVALAVALIGQNNFLAYYTNFILALLYILVPWTSVNLVDYYLIQHGNYDVPSFFQSDGGIYGRFQWVAILAYVFGIAVQTPFMATDFYTGPLAEKLGGADISWMLGLVLTSFAYYFGSSLCRKQSLKGITP